MLIRFALKLIDEGKELKDITDGKGRTVEQFLKAAGGDWGKFKSCWNQAWERAISMTETLDVKKEPPQVADVDTLFKLAHRVIAQTPAEGEVKVTAKQVEKLASTKQKQSQNAKQDVDDLSDKISINEEKGEIIFRLQATSGKKAESLALQLAHLRDALKYFLYEQGEVSHKLSSSSIIRKT